MKNKLAKLLTDDSGKFTVEGIRELDRLIQTVQVSSEEQDKLLIEIADKLDDFRRMIDNK